MASNVILRGRFDPTRRSAKQLHRNDGPEVPSAMGLCDRRWYNRSPSTGTEREREAPITSSVNETHTAITKRPWTQSTSTRTREEIWYAVS